MATSTIREFEYLAPVWPVVDSWAAAQGYKPVSEEAGSRTYQKGTGFLTAPMLLRVNQQGSRVRLEAWIRVNLFVRIFGLMLIPALMGIESGGFKLALPRKIARTAVNDLLGKLGQPLIG